MKPITKSFPTAAKLFELESRFDVEKLTEWHIISTAHKDHAGDVMSISGGKLPPVGRAIVLLNHDPRHSGGLPIGKALEYRVVAGSDGVDQLWQHTEYSRETPAVGPNGLTIGELTFRSRLNGFFTDSSINFIPTKWQENKDRGYDWLEWELLEAGPVVIGMNWFTGDMKSICMKSAIEMIAAAAGIKRCSGCDGSCHGDCQPADGKILVDDGRRTFLVKV
jgi:hypothetical protein